MIYLVWCAVWKMRTLRAVFIGESSVGKTTLLRRASKDSGRIVPTIGVDNALFDYDGVFFQCWDTSGQPQFRTVAKMFIEKSRLVIYMYDASKPETFVSENVPENAIIIANVSVRGTFPIDRDHLPFSDSNPQSIKDILDLLKTYAIVEPCISEENRPECCCCF